MKRANVILSVVLLLVLSACQTTGERLLDTDESQVALRSIQTRAFDTPDKSRALRAIVATLQDLGFVIDKADEEVGTVTATKLDRYALRMTVTVRPRGETQMLVRANAQYELKTVDDPEPYQDFFSALSKAMFLDAQNVE